MSRPERIPSYTVYADEPDSSELVSGTRRIAALSDDASPQPASSPSARPTVPVPNSAELAVLPEERPTVRCVKSTPRWAAIAQPFASSLPPTRLSASVHALGSLEGIPILSMSEEDRMALTFDPRRAFILGLIDGRTTIESVLDACPMAPQRVLTILGDFLARGIISVRRR